MSSVEAAPAPTVTFKKGPSRRPAQSRRRSASPAAPTDPSSSASASTSVVRPTKKALLNPLVQGTKRRRDLGSGDNEGEGEGGLGDLEYKASGALADRGDSYATRGADWDLDLEAGGHADLDDGTGQTKRVRLNEDGEIDDGLYRGTAGYLPTINKTREMLDSKMKTGPIRATANIRTITLVDYQPDVCKPYKETGFCGYGDSCKFLHDRGDYLAGWQLDDMANQGMGLASHTNREEEEDLPFACLICKKEFVDPVVTKCGHYFCMNCATKRFIKSPKCYACGAPTNGIFNKAEKILAKLEAKNKRIREANGEEDEEREGGIEIGGASEGEDEEQE